MKTLDQIEARFDFILPNMYRDLAQANRLNHQRKQFFEMPDCLWVVPSTLAKFSWDDGSEPVDGLVPFATNGCGDHLCWHLPSRGRGGENVVMECPHDSYEGRWFAPTLAGAVFRQSLEWLNIHAHEEELEQTYQTIDVVLEVLAGYVPKTWCAALQSFQKKGPKQNKYGDPVFLSDDEIDTIIGRSFSEKYVSNIFIWDKRGLPIDLGEQTLLSKKVIDSRDLKADRSLEKTIKSGVALIKKIKPCDASYTISRGAVPSAKMIQGLEAKINKPVPEELLRIMSGGDVFISWCMDSLSDDLPEEYDSFSSGQFYCDPDRLYQVEGDKQKHLKKARGRKTEMALWENAFAFDYCYYTSGFIALEVTDSGQSGRVMLLPSKGQKIQPSIELSPDFHTFLQRWAELAFVGLDDKAIKVLTNDFSKPMRSDTRFVKKWRKWLEREK
ncbi:MAG: SMI1/KNR4 family protein [Planctomycetota bacterium]